MKRVYDLYLITKRIKVLNISRGIKPPRGYVPVWLFDYLR
jgi:hypothetical protein